MSANFEYYKIFYYVAKYKNITQAANVLMSTQPSVTRSIQNLEHELNCRLFIRSRRGVSLTPEGELLFQHIAPACEHILKGEEELESALDLHGGTVYIGATETGLHCFLLERLKLFHQKYPGVHIKILNNSTPQAVADLLAGKTEMAVTTTPAEIGKRLKSTHVQSFRDVLVAGKAFSNLKDKTFRLKELEHLPIIGLSKGTMTYSFYEQLFLSHGLELKTDIELATSDLMLPVIKHDLGIGFVPEELAKPALDNGEIIEIKLEDTIPERHICILRDLQRPLSVAARQLLKMLN